MYSALSFHSELYPFFFLAPYLFRKQGAACGVWIDEYQMAHVPQTLATGPWFQNIGMGGKSGYWLLPEETLLMVSSGRMDLLDENGLDMGLIGAWSACIEAAGGVNAYLVSIFDYFTNLDIFSVSTSWLYGVSS
jgi:tRNA-splicing endonuclease subunit sen54 N-term